MGVAVSISSAILLRLMREAWLGERNEICGILLGRGEAILRADRTTNVAATPKTMFEIDPKALIDAYRRARRRAALSVLGYYHSHPGGNPIPSRHDAASAFPDGKLWLIITEGRAQLWRAVLRGELHGRFDPVAIDLIIGKRPPVRVDGVEMRGLRENLVVTEHPS